MVSMYLYVVSMNTHTYVHISFLFYRRFSFFFGSVWAEMKPEPCHHHIQIPNHQTVLAQKGVEQRRMVFLGDGAVVVWRG